MADSLKFTLDVRYATHEPMTILDVEQVQDQLWDTLIEHAERSGLLIGGFSNPSVDAMPPRQDANYDLVGLIEDEVRRHPDLRFGQILANLGIIEYLPRDTDDGPLKVRDPYHEESDATLGRVLSRKE